MTPLCCLIGHAAGTVSVVAHDGWTLAPWPSSLPSERAFRGWHVVMRSRFAAQLTVAGLLAGRGPGAPPLSPIGLTAADPFAGGSVKGGFACTLTRYLPPVLVVLRFQPPLTPHRRRITIRGSLVGVFAPSVVVASWIGVRAVATGDRVDGEPCRRPRRTMGWCAHGEASPKWWGPGRAPVALIHPENRSCRCLDGYRVLSAHGRLQCYAARTR